MFKQLICATALCGLAAATESFENLPQGALKEADCTLGKLSAADSHAAIEKGHARNGAQCLRLKGGDGRQVSLLLNEACKEDVPCEFWMERWTRKGSFLFRCVALANGTETEVYKLDKMDVGGYKQHVQFKLPAGTTELRLIADTGEAGGGVLIDDLDIHSGPITVKEVKVSKPGRYPLLKRAPINPAVGISISSQGCGELPLQSVSFRVSDPDRIAKVTLRSGNQAGSNFRNSRVFGSATPDTEGNVCIKATGSLDSGDNWLWLDAEPSESAPVGSNVSFSNVKIGVGGKDYSPDCEAVTQRIGYLLSVPGEGIANQPDGAADRPCTAFRIPGMIRTAKGSLIGCFDARYQHSGDLCADIDVAVVRSTDGGQTWSKPAVGMDSGPGAANGNGDPCIVQDKKGRIWMQSLVCHFGGGASLGVSKSGFDEKSTGQWEMVYSDDDGKTWSKEHINPTKQIKKEEWTCILAGPGNGICTSKGIIVFPAQIWQNGANPRCMSSICYSKDGGKNWVYGTGIPQPSSECQVVELANGELMLNCRNEARQGKRIVYTTSDLGQTWKEHESNNKALSEPTCQASLIRVKSKKHGDLLLFSNPKFGGRSHMTVRASRDGGKTWNEGYEYDSRGCWGYSCLAMTDPATIGIIYEAPHVSESSDMHGIAFLRLPLESVLTGEDIDAKAPKGGKGKKK